LKFYTISNPTTRLADKL